MKLRPFQAELVAAVRAAYAGGAMSAVMQLGTGGGKTFTAAEIIRLATQRGRRVVFAAHLDSLIEDTHERLTAAGIHAGFIQASRPIDPTAPVQVCSLATLHRRGERPPADLLVVDECHRAMAATVRPILEAYPKAHLLGLTATPQRGDGQPLGDVFQALVCGPSNRWLIDEGFLVPCELLAPANDTGDALAMDPVDAYRLHTPDTRAIVFATNVAHAEDIARRFIEAGIPAECVTGESPRVIRQGIRARLRSGELRVLVGVGIFIEGFDEPCIQTVILARAFTVTGAYLQAIGRGLRPFEGKLRCTVIDLRGAVMLHGLPDEERAWSLDGTAVRRLEQMTALQKCKACLAVFRPSAACPRCGARTSADARMPRVLKRAERLERFSSFGQSDRDARYLAKLEGLARTRLRLPEHRIEAWALAKFRKQFKREPEGKAA